MVNSFYERLNHEQSDEEFFERAQRYHEQYWPLLQSSERLLFPNNCEGPQMYYILQQTASELVSKS